MCTHNIHLRHPVHCQTCCTEVFDGKGVTIHAPIHRYISKVGIITCIWNVISVHNLHPLTFDLHIGSGACSGSGYREIIWVFCRIIIHNTHFSCVHSCHIRRIGYFKSRRTSTSNRGTWSICN